MTRNLRRAIALPVAVLLAATLASCSQPVVRETPLPVTLARPIASPTPLSLPSATAIPSPAQTAISTPIPTAVPTPTPAPQPFAMNLFEPGDFVPQHTFDWCVGASIQMAWNLARPEVRSSYEDQQALWEMARDRSSNSFRGANPHGWAAVLTEIGLGHYELVSVPEYDEALRVAATAMRTTDRAVGLVMWRGRHAWLMNGFTATGDPALHDDVAVTGVYVLDPLYPHGSGTWGPSPAPNSLLSPEALATQLVVREPRRWSESLGAGYLLVLPVADSASAAAARPPVP